MSFELGFFVLFGGGHIFMCKYNKYISRANTWHFEIECLKDLVTMRTTIFTTVCLNDINETNPCTRINGEMVFPASEKGNADSQSSQKT